jgi:hypothetical protein
VGFGVCGCRRILELLLNAAGFSDGSRRLGRVQEVREFEEEILTDQLRKISRDCQIVGNLKVLQL